MIPCSLLTFLVVQWLKKLLAATAGGAGLIPDLGNKIHMPLGTPKIKTDNKFLKMYMTHYIQQIFI